MVFGLNKSDKQLRAGSNRKYFDCNCFSKCYSKASYAGIEEDIIATYKKAFEIKLTDIFTTGFTVPDRMRAAAENAKVSFASDINCLLNFHDVLLEVAVSDIPSEYVIVFNPELTLPSPSDQFLGFVTKTEAINSKAKSKGQDSYSRYIDRETLYREIPIELKLKFPVNAKFLANKKKIQRELEMTNLMFDRAVRSQKTIMTTEAAEKQSTAMAETSDFPWLKSLKADGMAYDRNDIYSVLMVPPETQISMPTADMTQIIAVLDKLRDDMLSVFEIPATIWYGQTPNGFQNSGNLDIQIYYKSVERIFFDYIKPVLVRIAELLGVEPQISFISFYNLELLRQVNDARLATNSSVIQSYCDDIIARLSGNYNEVEEINTPEIVQTPEVTSV